MGPLVIAYSGLMQENHQHMVPILIRGHFQGSYLSALLEPLTLPQILNIRKQGLRIEIL
jgi:hypothetical protein